MNDLVYDLGLHTGQDTEFYLKKGFRVVAIEANADLCRQVGERLKDFVDDGRLTIVNKAIAKERGVVRFYKSQESQWSTVIDSWAERNERLGSKSQVELVEAVSLAELIEQFGGPYFIKIDIEGMDRFALEELQATEARPKFLSIESDKVSFQALREEFAILSNMGYDRFKVVQQWDVPRQVPPSPAREGSYAEHRFTRGASGLFGEEAPGEWLTAEEAINRYKAVFWHYRLYGDRPIIGGEVTRKVARKLGFHPGWYDTHAKHSSAP